MTNKQKTQRVLEAIRNAPGNEGLKKLGFGCEIKITEKIENDDYPLEQTVTFYADGNFGEQSTVITAEVGEMEYDFEIIGHPVKWSNVLIAIGGKYSFTGKGGIWKVKGIKWTPVSFTLSVDLTKTPEEEMESNTELTDFLADLLGVK